jgi:NAD+ synthase (glutamine-hydrolysing)
MLCEDAWNMDYSVAPLDNLAAAGADLLVNCSASPFTAGKNSKRRRVFGAHADRWRRPLLYVNHVGIQNNGKTVFTFDGASCLYDGHGGCMAAGDAFSDDVLTVDIPLDGGTGFAPPMDRPEDGIGAICSALLYGTRKFMDLCGVGKVVVGLSGGIDSAVVAALYRRLLPPENLLLVNMPGPYTSATTRELAARLASALGCLQACIPIDDSVALTCRQVDGLEVGAADGSLSTTLALSPFMRENVQARDRSSRLLAAAAAAFGGVFTCNANKSETTVGYTTLYGDLGGYLANLADLWKTEVYALARHLNEEVYGQAVIPRGCMDIVPSAELSAAQDVDRGGGDPLVYAYHDRLFESWVEWWNRAGPEEALAWYTQGVLEAKLGYDGRVDALFPTAEAFVEDLERWWDLYTGMGVAKRIQAPPVLAVKRRAFGFDHRESQMGRRYTRRYHALRNRTLSRARGAEASRSR